MNEAAVPAAGAAPHWQRLHPATLALEIVALGPRSLQFLPAIAALGFTGNWVWIVPAILAFLLLSLLAAWFKWLRRRSQRHRLTWERYAALYKTRWALPRPRIAVRIWGT